MIALLCAVFALAGPSTPATSPEDVVRAMRDRYDGEWYRTLTFVQVTTTYGQDGGVARTETWYESMQLPGRLRIDVEPLPSRVLLFRNDSLYTVRDGQPAPPRALVHGLLLMGFDVYHLPAEETIRKLAGLGVDMSKLHETTWRDRDVWVIGADAGDDASNQFWIDKERLVFVRQLNGTTEVQFNDYRRLGGGWVSAEVAFFRDGRPVTLEQYSQLETGGTFEDGVFDPARLTRPGWIPEGGS